MKTLCLGYLAAMTWMLFSTASARMVRAGAAAYEPLREAATIGHFLGFTVLAVLTLAPRWRVPRWAVGAALLIAALGSELLQTVIPGRTPDPADAAQNLLGIAVGAAFAWLIVARRESRFRGYDRPPLPPGEGLR